MDLAEWTALKDKLCLNASSNYMHMKVTPGVSVGFSPKWDCVCKKCPSIYSWLFSQFVHLASILQLGIRSHNHVHDVLGSKIYSNARMRGVKFLVEYLSSE